MFRPKIILEGNYCVIVNFPSKMFLRDCYKFFSSSKFKNILFTFGFFKNKIKIHQFFLPEMVYLLEKFSRRVYDQIIQLLYKETWLRETIIEHTSRINRSRIAKLNIELKPYQKEFIELYDERKQKYNLRGLILAFEQGLGKTITSLALMESLEKDCIIIVAPKSTTKTVWVHEINRLFPSNKEIWLIGDKPKKARFYIVNYESIPKLSQVSKYISASRNPGIIVDECHNFRSVGAKRVENLLFIARVTNCDDILLMSGTPIKALGSEMIPSLQLIDRLFDDEALQIFKKTFGLSTEYAIEILRNRLGLMMHRKTKGEVLKLPAKTHHEIKIKIPNGYEYTEEYVKKKVLSFIDERKEYYRKNFKQFEKDYYECIDYLKYDKKLSKDENFIRYIGIVEYLRKNGYSNMDTKLVEDVRWANKYEKDVLRPLLPPELRKKFDASKTVIKYVDMKIMGEVLGGLLNRLRSSMFAEMIKHSPLCDIIHEAQKKTVCFTTYVDVAKHGMEHCVRECKLSPILITGETSKNIKDILQKFKDDDDANPIVATIQTLSTGVTLIEANTVVFLNQPWRHVDRVQAEDRVHRIGQDTDVFIYTYILDTGGKRNLSTRMEDIVQWSKDLFEGIIGDEIPKISLYRYIK